MLLATVNEVMTNKAFVIWGAMLWLAVSARADFVPGHLYVPSERFIYEYDLDLNLTRSISMVGIHRGSTGATFSPSGRRQKRRSAASYGCVCPIAD